MTCKFYHITCVILERAQSVLSGGGKQGFEGAISEDSFILDGVGAFGSVQSERGLTYVEVPLSGHM